MAALRPAPGPWLLAVLLLLGLAGSPARAEDPLAAKVPLLGNATLPVAGTGAPMARTNVTHVMVGELGYYRVADLPGRILTRTQLRELLRARAGRTRPSAHEVWITATRDHIWAQVRLVRLVCQEAGIYRVGLRIRHETAPQILGFPLFLPAGAGPARPGKASRLPLVVEARGEEPGSDPRILYQAVRRAREKYGQDVVAEVRVQNVVRIQTVLTALDMLHRAGCAGVNLKSVRNVPTTRAAPFAAIRIVRYPRGKDVILPPAPLAALEIPPVAPRTTPWPLSGANQPGALGMELEELPVRGEARPHVVEDTSRPLPFHLRRGAVPPAEAALAARRILAWGTYLGRELLAGIRRDGRVARQFVVRLRPLPKLSPVMTPVARAYARATEVRLRRLTLELLVSRAGHPIGVYDLELRLEPRRISVVRLRAVPGEIPRGVTLPPEAVDPFAAGTPGRVRVFVESLLLAARRGGVRALPVAPDAELLGACPASARAATERALADRRTELPAAVARLAAAPFDRVYLTVRGARADARAGTRLLGSIDLGLEAEEGALRIAKLGVRRGR